MRRVRGRIIQAHEDRLARVSREQILGIVAHHAEMPTEPRCHYSLASVAPRRFQAGRRRPFTKLPHDSAPPQWLSSGRKKFNFKCSRARRAASRSARHADDSVAHSHIYRHEISASRNIELRPPPAERMMGELHFAYADDAGQMLHEALRALDAGNKLQRQHVSSPEFVAMRLALGRRNRFSHI